MKQKYIGSSKYCNNEYWPPVESTTSISPVIKELMNENSENIIRKLQSISTVENYDENLTNALGGFIVYFLIIRILRFITRRQLMSQIFFV
ncbi:hypothetical protein BSPWISOXPB_11351 [uncultured Gammaproteobacteria bacterium]|nr:hypothetical protein BSPWISOXPB_5495 [uncultured Gammaproteobacteria bacterium]VVM26937.1 hypothetical protein BSPWISOXPB_11351 [uncultured Gammaproteobacteria bacterium]